LRLAVARVDAFEVGRSFQQWIAEANLGHITPLGVR
jgi:hypothetical protein